MKKNLIIFLILVTAILVPISVFAASFDTQPTKAVNERCLGIDISKLTEEQKTDIKNYIQKKIELQKEFINTLVENGSITKEQGDTAINRIDSKIEKFNENGFELGLPKRLGTKGKFGGSKEVEKRRGFRKNLNSSGVCPNCDKSNTNK